MRARPALPGMSAMVEKFQHVDFGRCPRVYCQGQPCLPVGQSDIPRQRTVKIFCPVRAAQTPAAAAGHRSASVWLCMCLESCRAASRWRAKCACLQSVRRAPSAKLARRECSAVAILLSDAKRSLVLAAECWLLRAQKCFDIYFPKQTRSGCAIIPLALLLPPPSPVPSTAPRLLPVLLLLLLLLFCGTRHLPACPPVDSD